MSANTFSFSIKDVDPAALEGVDATFRSAAERFRESLKSARDKKIIVDREASQIRVRQQRRNETVSESEVAEAIGKFLVASGKESASIKELQAEIGQFLHLSEADLKLSQTRPRERVWEQKIRNVVSHRQAGGNAIAEGWLSYPTHGVIGITDEGRRKFQEKTSI